ncbi:hypothetical protein DUNSADRAFT_11609 [Dunaliella salina]|uniref:Thioredoxin domain-containing protein n=1 Tax=Dunaliella salina TaxID=3046 RepID=A0ABQ7GCY5_DUNSA|nr:hypothetical protein DUNSADRAFT_11609 [Dunaliella salina]|eukprot:KAF5832472.1 hypothetical protein DUNSADRAFT_11609 [Dunaliella salina]
MYSSDYDLQTGETWCPDCKRAVPGVLSALKENGVGSLLLVRVGSRAEWKSPDHPFKTDPSLKISGVPTLVRLRPGGSEAARLGPELESSATAEEAKQLAASFITKAD